VGAGEFVGGMDFAEDVERVLMSAGGEAGELGAGERGDDEEDGVGAVGAGFDDLVFVDDEIFAEAGDLCRG
jgi:hypothetical protein